MKSTPFCRHDRAGSGVFLLLRRGAAIGLPGHSSGQYEAGFAIGLSRTKTMLLVIVPQLIRIALPGIVNLWMNLLKDTALVSVIGLSDIIRQTGIAARVTKEAFLFYTIACALYLLLAILSSIAIGYIENWTKQSGANR